MTDSDTPLESGARTVLVADDHPLFRAALRHAVEQALPGARVVELASHAALRAAAQAHSEADLVLLDLMMPDSRSFAPLAWLRSQHSAMAVIVVSANESLEVMQSALELGAAGYVPKSAPLPELVAAIRLVADCGQSFPPQVYSAPPRAVASEIPELGSRLASLTPQQFRVLELVAQGLLNKQIAAELGITEQTTKAHVSAALAKLGARNRTQATLAFRSLEIQDADQLSFEG